MCSRMGYTEFKKKSDFKKTLLVFFSTSIKKNSEASQKLNNSSTFMLRSGIKLFINICLSKYKNHQRVLMPDQASLLYR